MTNVGDAARGVAAAQTGMKLPPPEVLKVGPPPIFGPADPAYRVPIDQPRPDNKAGTLQDYIRGKVRGRCAEVGKQRNQDPQEIYDMVKTLLGVEHLMEAHADLLLEGGYVYKLIAAFDEVPF